MQVPRTVPLPAARQGSQALQEAVAELESLVVQLKRERLLAELAVGGPEASAAATTGRVAAALSASLVVLGQAYRRVAVSRLCLVPVRICILATCLSYVALTSVGDFAAGK